MLFCRKSNGPFSAASQTPKPTQALGGAKVGHQVETRRETFVFFVFGKRRWAPLYSQRLHCLVPRREQQDRLRGPFPTKWSINTTIPLFSCLDLPSEQQLVIKLTSQQARPGPCFPEHCGALRRKLILSEDTRSKSRGGIDSSQQPWRWGMGTVAAPLCQTSRGRVLKGQPFNPWQPWRTETDLLFVFDVVPLSRHIQPEDETVVHAKASDRWSGCNTVHCSEAVAALARITHSCVVHLLRGKCLEWVPQWLSSWKICMVAVHCLAHGPKQTITSRAFSK